MKDFNTLCEAIGLNTFNGAVFENEMNFTDNYIQFIDNLETKPDVISKLTEINPRLSSNLDEQTKKGIREYNKTYTDNIQADLILNAIKLINKQNTNKSKWRGGKKTHKRKNNRKTKNKKHKNRNHKSRNKKNTQRGGDPPNNNKTNSGKLSNLKKLFSLDYLRYKLNSTYKYIIDTKEKLAIGAGLGTIMYNAPGAVFTLVGYAKDSAKYTLKIIYKSAEYILYIPYYAITYFADALICTINFLGSWVEVIKDS